MYVCPECGESSQVQGYCPADGTALAPRGDDHLLGQSVGPYRIAGLLGEGGMGRVYKGVHPSIGSRVAVKVLANSCVQNPEMVERFFAEARAVNLIRHESIVNVLDLNTLPDGRPYIVMEYLDGAPLADIIEKQGPLPLGGLARLIGEVLDALSAAHVKGIVHRDLKPDNIFVSPQGRAKVLDFGIAKLMPELSGGVGPTRTGSLLGTPHYMAPEQAMAKGVDARTDVYSIGVILYEGVTGRRPFSAGSLLELLNKQVHDPPPPPRSRRPDLPPQYEGLILRAMAKEPAHRFQSAAELAAALSHVAQGLPPHAWEAVSPTSGRSRQPIGPQSVGHSLPPATGPSPVSHVTGPTPAVMQHSLATSTASGQMKPYTAHPVRRSRAGWWIGGIAVAALVGVAIAVAASGGSESADETRSIAGIDNDDDADDLVGGVDLPDLEALQNLDKLDPTERIAAMQKMAHEAEAAAEKAVARAQKDAEEALARANLLAAKSLEGAGKKRLPKTYVPAGFNPKKFDVSGFLDTATEHAKEYYQDAVLIRIDAEGVYPDGHADITLSERFYINYRFVSPSGAKRPKDLPIGVDYEPNCLFHVWVRKDGVTLQPADGWKCEEVLIGEPECTVAQVMKKALEKGAPRENAVAQVGYREWDDKPRWYVTVGKFSTYFADKCK